MITAITDADFEEKVLKNDGLVLIDFWAEWCGPCRTLAPMFAQLAEEFGDRVTFSKMNIDDNPNTPSKLGIKGIPFLMLFFRGQLVDTRIGAITNRILLEEWLSGYIRRYADQD